jgi:hypothetical protein
MERSLRRAGVGNVAVLKPFDSGPWRNSIKIGLILRYLEQTCRTKYVLYVDSDDAILLDDLRRALDCLLEAGCDLLFASTRFAGGCECMPDVKAWADKICRAKGYKKLYPNSGVYIGRTSAVLELMRAASMYVGHNDLAREEYIRRRREGTLRDALPAFPYGVGCDQVIFRFLDPRFCPSVKIDYASRLAAR